MNVRNLRAAGMVSSLLVVLVACASPASPGWTYAPASSPPAASPAGSASAPPAASPSAPAGSPAPSASGAPAGQVVRIAANNIAFDQAELAVPAGQPFSLVFDNQEPVPHNVAIYTDTSAGQSLFVGEIFAGPGERTYAVPAIPAGSYFYRCDVHPTQMTGTLVAG